MLVLSEIIYEAYASSDIGSTVHFETGNSTVRYNFVAPLAGHEVFHEEQAKSTA
jgi:hypothetical protein